MVALKDKQVICIIQARMGSKRLPGKSLMKLGSKPLVRHVLERCLKAKCIDKVVLATTQKPEDDAICEEVKKIDGAVIFRGSSSDLIDRYYNAAMAHKADIVVRVPADNPLILPCEIDRIIQYFSESDLDFASNLGPYLDNGYPDGLGAEVMSMKVLSELHANVKSAHHREHVTSIFREVGTHYRCGTCLCDEDFSRPDVILDVNTEQEYIFMNKVITYLEKKDAMYLVDKIIEASDKFTNVVVA